MFERFTDRARKVMAIANQEVQRFNHEYIGTEHILLGLIKEGSGTGATVLKNLGVDIEKMLLEMEQLFKLKGRPNTVTMDKRSPTTLAKKLLNMLSKRPEALIINTSVQNTFCWVCCGRAAQVLVNLGLSIEGVRMEILKLLNQQE